MYNLYYLKSLTVIENKTIILVLTFIVTAGEELCLRINSIFNMLL